MSYKYSYHKATIQRNEFISIIFLKVIFSISKGLHMDIWIHLIFFIKKTFYEEFDVFQDNLLKMKCSLAILFFNVMGCLTT
jgi:hypothetical protein